MEFRIKRVWSGEEIENSEKEVKIEGKEENVEMEERNAIKIECDYEGCKKLFANECDYHNHYVSSHLNAFSCPFPSCSFVSCSQRLLDIHELEFHSPFIIKNPVFLCPFSFCSCVFHSENERSLHLGAVHNTNVLSGSF